MCDYCEFNNSTLLYEKTGKVIKGEDKYYKEIQVIVENTEDYKIKEYGKYMLYCFSSGYDQGKDVFVPVNFCHMCGRKLGE